MNGDIEATGASALTTGHMRGHSVDGTPDNAKGERYENGGVMTVSGAGP